MRKEAASQAGNDFSSPGRIHVPYRVPDATIFPHQEDIRAELIFNFFLIPKTGEQTAG
ncbi:hypothetical protein [Methanovulcanius yangii]|uniref:hypothetical protein n=1 Tax=Methanovulcanius yangii TaxID=1789227 RepID=UPI0029CA93F7|nr:hypothetical protein [Methanovulcanius yangii]